MMMMFFVLGQAAAEAISPVAVGTILGAVIAALVGGGVLGKKVSDSNKTLIQNSPLDVRLKEEFVTRREFEKLELTMNAHISEIKGTVISSTTRMEGLFNLTMERMESQTTRMTTKVERQSKDLREEIGKVASGAYQGRQKLWIQVNENRDHIAGLKATTDVAGELGKLAVAMQATKSTNTKIQPTHNHNQS